jgi:CheY-like chemotaxis protein
MNIPKILLVDDTSFFLEVEKSLLAVSPVHLLTAADGEEALHLVRTERPDLVIMDYVMPKMDGKKCCATLKADPDLCSIPVIMVTTSDRLEDIRACFDAGCNDFLSKPLDRKRFLEKVRNFMPVIDRRKLRVSCRMQVTLQFDETVATVESVDLSIDGIFLRSDLKIPLGARVQLSFTLPGVSESVTKARGRVAWLNDVKTSLQVKMPIGFGVEFDEITGEGLASLRKKELRAFIDAYN